MITSPVASATTTPATTPAAPASIPTDYRWSEPKLFGRAQNHSMYLFTHQAVDGYPGLTVQRHKMFDSPSVMLDGAQVAGNADARRAVDELRTTFAALTAEDLGTGEDVHLPVRGTLVFPTSGGAYVTFPLKSDNPRVAAFTDAVLGLAATARANAREI